MIAENADEISYMLKSLERPSVGLTDWDLAFLNRISDLFNDSGNLSIAQFNHLKEIYVEKGQTL